MRTFPYSVHPAVSRVQSMIAELPQKTGRTADEWIAVLRSEAPPDEAARRVYLKRYGLGTYTAWWLAERAAGKDMGIPDSDPDTYVETAQAYVEAMFASKSALVPVYERLIERALALGGDVRVCPGKTIVPLYRHNAFAELKPATKTRLDLGLALGNTPILPPLTDTGGWDRKHRITRRIALSLPSDITPDVERWLRTAYERAAPTAENDVP